MNRWRIDGWRRLLSESTARPRRRRIATAAAAAAASPSRTTVDAPLPHHHQRRLLHAEPAKPRRPPLSTTQPHNVAAAAAAAALQDVVAPDDSRYTPVVRLSPVQHSAKLAALHARLSLPRQLPLETLARALIDPSGRAPADADADAEPDNANLAFLGSTLVNYHTTELLMCRYPRLPMLVMYEAMRAYAGPESLAKIARQWGVESVAGKGAMPGVDPGLLRFSEDPAARAVISARWGYVRRDAETMAANSRRRGVSSRVIVDDPFGDLVMAAPGRREARDEAEAEDTAGADGQQPRQHLTPADEAAAEAAAIAAIRSQAHANFVSAVVGAISVHAGGELARLFVRAHVLSRQIDMAAMFRFELPTRELAQLCAREQFDPPVARILSETGRLSRTPVFVVGIYSGADKLGEGAGPSPDFARLKAAMNALRAWYLYSPAENPAVPSQMLAEDAPARWKPVYVDMGEIV